jgi:hypothetical protein
MANVIVIICFMVRARTRATSKGGLWFWLLL